MDSWISLSHEQALNNFENDLQTVTKKVHDIFNGLFEDHQQHFIASPANQANPVEVKKDLLNKTLTKKIHKLDLFEEKLNFLRQFKNSEIKKILETENKSHTRRQDILTQLSLVAECVCQHSLDLAYEELKPKYGLPTYSTQSQSTAVSELLVLGMGKLGGQEINYESDLDLIFIFSENGYSNGPKSISNAEYFSRLVQKFISILTLFTPYGRAYQVDTELRPSGNFGTLVTTLENFTHYQNQASQIWERQSLLRARPIAGTSSFSRLVQRHIDVLLYSKPYPQHIRDEMDRLRKRVEMEIANEDKTHWDFKGGLGGIMDIEFIVQYYQLIQGSEHHELQTPNTFAALDALYNLSILPKTGDAILLKEIYTFYRSFESHLSLLSKRSVHRFSLHDQALKNVAQKLQFNSTAELLDQYDACRQRIRDIYNHTFI